MTPPTTIEFQRPIREANAALRRGGDRLIVPLVIVGLLSVAATRFIQFASPRHAFLIEWIEALAIRPILDGVAEVVVVARFLRWDGDVQMGGSDVVRVLRYTGMARTLFGYAVRLYGSLAFATVIVVALLAERAVLRNLFPSLQSMSRAGWEYFIWFQVLYLLWWVVMSQYQLALPFLAISRGSALDLLRESSVRSRSFRWTLAKFSAVQFLCAGVISTTLLHVLRLHYPATHPVSVGAAIVVAIFDAAISTWFLVVRTGIALQVCGGLVPTVPSLPETETLA